MKYYFLPLCMLWALGLLAQNSLSGAITDKTSGETLPGVMLSFTDLKRSAISDEKGAYHFDNLPQGTYLLEIRYTGYETQTSQVQVHGATHLDIAMNNAVTEFNEVVITGASRATELKNHPIAVSTISAGDLQQVSSSNLIDAIARKPGISQISTGAGISKPVIRGLGYNRIITLYNGIRQEGQQWGDEHGIEIDEFSVDRVEILKGPGSLMYGSDALAGVIHFLSPNPLPAGEMKGSAILNYQTNNSLLGASINHAGNINGFNWLIRGSMKAAADYRNAYDGKVWNSGFQERNLNGYLGWNKNWGYSHFNFSTFNQKLGLIEGERDSLGRFLALVKTSDTSFMEAPAGNQGYKLSIPRQAIQHSRLSNTTSIILGNYRTEFSFGFQQNRRNEFADVLHEDRAELKMRLNTWNYDLKLVMPEKNAWQTTFGINGMAQGNHNAGTEALIPNYSLFDAGVYGITEKNWHNLTLSGGLRYDRRKLEGHALYIDENDHLTKTPTETVKFKAFEGIYEGVSGSIGASYRPSKMVTLKLNTARGFRAPNIAETGANGVHEGTYRYEIGNPGMSPEFSWQSDLGFYFTGRHITLEASLFYNRIDHYVFARKLLSTSGGDSIPDLNNPVPAFRFEQGNAHLYGGEINLDIHPHPLDWLHFENTFSWVRGLQNNVPDSMQSLPFIPAPRLSTELRVDFSRTGQHIRKAFAYLESVYTFKQPHYYAAFGTETATPGYFLLHAGLGGNLVNTKGKTLCTVYLIGNNLLDAAYQSHLSRLKYAPVNPLTGRAGVYEMGRNLSLKVLVPFG